MADYKEDDEMDVGFTAEEQTVTPKKKSVAEGKEISKLSMIIGGVWICVGTALVGLGVLDLTIKDVILSGFALIACYSPIFISVHMDKIIDYLSKRD